VPSITDWAASRPDANAIVSREGTRTFAELDAAANRLVRALRAQGLDAGDAVALVCGNRPEFGDVYFACQRAGFRLTPINWHLTAEEIAYIVGDCEAKVLIADGAIEAVANARRGVPRCGVGIAVNEPIRGCLGYEELVGGQDADPIEDPTPGGMMLYTSGTTGRAKGVHRPPSAPSSIAGVNLGGYNQDGGDVHLCTGPLYHAAPLAFSFAMPLAWGATVVLMSHWDAEQALRLVEECEVTHTHMVPTMFHRLLSLPRDTRERFDVSSLRHVIHGAAPCPVAVKQGMIEWLGPIIWEYYAATEGVGTLVDSATWLAHPGTVGRPLGREQVLIGDEEGAPLPAREVGLVYLKAPRSGRFSYFHDEEKTQSTFRGDYFTLGDVGYLDEEGFLYLTDRSADLIVSGGVNIYPAEVDSVLLEHPWVADVATIGVPDEEWGESVVSVVELQAGISPSDALASDLTEFCRTRIAHYKCPRVVEFIDALPRQDNGKLYKRVLRERFRASVDASRSIDKGGAVA
jgi:long-chain acyl-CoA synthetase